MTKNTRREVKRFELAKLAGKYFKQALTPSNIKARFRHDGILPLNPDAIFHDIVCSQSLDVHDNEDGDVVENIVSLSHGHY